MHDNEYVNELIEVLKLLGTNKEQAVDHYSRRVFIFIKNISIQELDAIVCQDELEQMAVYPIILGVLFKNGDVCRISRIIDEELLPCLIGNKRVHDYFVGLIVKFFYLARKSQGMDCSALFSLLVTNRELGNEHTVSVITNCLLDMLVSNKIFQRIQSKVCTASEQARYSYYTGIISMVEGMYDEALRNFHTSVVLSSSKGLVDAAEKRIILCMLLNSNYSIPYKYKRGHKAYFELVSAVKRADLKTFEEVLERNKQEYVTQGVYFVARRLMQNVIQEGIRKISIVYSRISCNDIACLLGIDAEEVEYVVKRTMRKGLVRGQVVDGVFYSMKETKNRCDIGIGIQDCVHLTRYIQEHMRYPAIEPLCYEKIKKAGMSE
ncbi:26S proteasome non-ATPase regulatory subunit 3 [Ordospora colligata]|uniref:PCI domain-containing protein n=1 Tax=Ordospora colligata OC4 TaxID=1354746 RepID=A0A0B2ULG9_9MICR|nr:PCI domain-containing protein [Ordospora colligata OC4]KHN69810.1 PCI domain-containing protein [Ordospora colligata OC4]